MFLLSFSVQFIFMSYILSIDRVNVRHNFVVETFFVYDLLIQYYFFFNLFSETLILHNVIAFVDPDDQPAIYFVELPPIR